MYLPDGRVRKLRRSSEDPGCAHELTFSCYRRLPLLSGDCTRQWFIDALDATRRRHDLEFWAYVIMPDHVHILFVPCDAQYRIRNVLQSIKQPVMRRALNFLREHNPEWLKNLRVRPPSGCARSCHPDAYHFWQPGGGYDRNVTTAHTAWRMVHYIHENPVRRGLVERSIDWPWSRRSLVFCRGRRGLSDGCDSAGPVMVARDRYMTDQATAWLRQTVPPAEN